MSFDYTELDAAICDHIAAGRGHPTNSTKLENIARGISSCSVPWRMIDRRMQAMRKNGRISFIGRKWVVNS